MNGCDCSVVCFVGLVLCRRGVLGCVCVVMLCVVVFDVVYLSLVSVAVFIVVCVGDLFGFACVWCGLRLLLVMLQ